MSGVPNKQIETWEDEGGGGAPPGPHGDVSQGHRKPSGKGAPHQAAGQRGVRSSGGGIQGGSPSSNGRGRTETEMITAILEEKRSEVMSKEDAGYYICGWQEIGDPVRQLVFQDARYQANKTNWPLR